MSAGAFVTARYEAVAAVAGPPAVPAITVSCRVQPETLALTIGGVANASSANALSAGFPRAIVSASSRRKGIIRTRGVRIRFTGALPAGYKAGTIIFLPWMVISTFAPIAFGQTGVYQTLPIEVVGTRPGTIS